MGKTKSELESDLMNVKVFAILFGILFICTFFLIIIESQRALNLQEQLEECREGDYKKYPLCEDLVEEDWNFINPIISSDLVILNGHICRKNYVYEPKLIMPNRTTSFWLHTPNKYTLLVFDSGTRVFIDCEYLIEYYEVWDRTDYDLDLAKKIWCEWNEIKNCEVKER